MHADHPFAAFQTQRYFLATEAHREALARLGEGLGTREPFLLVTGEAGTGKTALVIEAIDGWGSRAMVAFLANPALTRLELVEAIAQRFGAEPPANVTKPQLLSCLERALAQVAERGQVAVIVVDDAHALAPELLDELRLIANSEAQSRRPLEIVLIGLPRLEATLAEPAFAPLRQRIAVHCQLSPLSQKSTRRYLYERLTAVGIDHGLLPRESCRAIYASSLGVPRAINALATEAIRRARDAGVESVAPEHVYSAANALWSGGRVGESTTFELDEDSEEPGSFAAPSPPAAVPHADAPSNHAPPVERQELPRAEPEPKRQPASPPASATPAQRQEPQRNDAEMAPRAEEPPASRTSVQPREPRRNAEQAPRAEESPAGAAPVARHEPRRSDTPARDVAPKAAAGVDDEPPTVIRTEPHQVSEWVARFIGEQGPPRIGSLYGPMRQVETDEILAPPRGSVRRLVTIPDDAEEPSSRHSGNDTKKPPGDAAVDASVGEREWAAQVAARSPKGRRRPGAATMVAIVLVAIVLIALVAIMLLPNLRQRFADRWRTQVTTSAVESAEETTLSTAVNEPPVAAPIDVGGSVRRNTAPKSAKLPKTKVVTTTNRKSTLSTDRKAALAADRKAALTTDRKAALTLDRKAALTIDRLRAARVGVGADTASAPSKRLALKVATYINFDRAIAERDRLVRESGLHAWILTRADQGAESYDILLGTFSSSERADAAGTMLLGRGLISEARVVGAPAKRKRN